MSVPALARGDLVAEIEALRAARAEIGERFNEATGLEAHRLGEHYAYYDDRLARMADAYTASLPEIPLARCPLTDEVVSHAIDVTGLDGPWWDQVRPVRASDALVKPPLVSFAGAIVLDPVPGPVSFPRLTGPEVPYVHPSLLARQDVVGVVRELEVAGRRAYLVAYFSTELGPLEDRPALWGQDGCPRRHPEGPLVTSALSPLSDGLDFDLAPWIEAGDLRWIASDDDAFELRDDIEECPYLDLDGRRELAYLEDGDLRWIAPLSPDDTTEEP